jgi:hypothetical protein
MKQIEKIEYLQKNHFSKWIIEQDRVKLELSYNQQLFCICGCIATGLHEKNCSKFNNKVTSETVKRLKYLISSK